MTVTCKEITQTIDRISDCITNYWDLFGGMEWSELVIPCWHCGVHC